MDRQEREKMLDELKSLTQTENNNQESQFHIHNNQTVVINFNSKEKECVEEV